GGELPDFAPDTGSALSLRRRGAIAAFVALALVCVAVAGGYAVHAQKRGVRVSAGPAAANTAALAAALAVPHVVFRDMAIGEAGRVAVAPLDAPSGPRQVTGIQCERVYMAAGNGLCLN